MNKMNNKTTQKNQLKKVVSKKSDKTSQDVSEYRKHDDVPKKYRWDLSFLLNGNTVEAAMADAIAALRAQLPLKETKYTSPELYLMSLRLADDATKKIYRIVNYLNNSISLNVTDSKMNMLMDSFRNELIRFELEYGPDLARFFDHAAQISKWAKLPKFKEYKYFLEHRLEGKKHVLPKAIEEYRQKVARAEPDFMTVFEILDSAELEKGYATDSKGKKIKIDNSNLSLLLESEDASTRKTAFMERRASYMKLKETFAQLIFQHKRNEAVDAKVKNYSSTTEMLMFGDRTDEQFLLSLFSATSSHVTKLRDFWSKWDYFYELKFKEKPNEWDYSRKFFVDKRKIDVEEGINQFLASIAPFGAEHVKQVKVGLDQNWVDFFSVKNKRGGAYSIGNAYGIEKKLILMNWDFTSRSVETLAHEFGHSMHSYYVENNNSQTAAHTRIFYAEIASILNELLLMDYWLKNSKSDEQKFTILHRFIDGFSGTVFRQILFSNYEHDFYKALDEEKSVNSYDALAKMFYENYQKYSGRPKQEFKPEEMFMAIAVPHFYYGFYVHKYAIGQLVACIFYQRYKERGSVALQEYIDTFLKAGSDQNPLDLLKASGIDLHDPKAYDLGFKAFEENVKEWILLGTKMWGEPKSRSQSVKKLEKSSSKSVLGKK